VIPRSDVVTPAVRVVLEPDGGHEVTVGKLWVQRFDFVVGAFYKLLATNFST
jgi:hypothetical protein